MCQRTDLRTIVPATTSLGLLIGAYEVDENGQPTGPANPGFLASRLTAPAPVPDYICEACGQPFGSWLEASLHLNDLDE